MTSGSSGAAGIDHRFLTYLLLVTLVLPRAVFAGTAVDAVAVLVAWTGLLLGRRPSRIPRAYTNLKRVD